MKKHLLYAFLGVLTCYSCNSYDLLENDAELAKVAESYELSTRAIEDEMDTMKIETEADESSIRAVMDEYVEGLMNRQAVAKEKVMRTVYAATTDVVGIFKVGSCGTYKELELLIDAEDTRQQSFITGNVGDTYINNSGNPIFKFCLTEASQYYPGGVFLVNHINYTQFGGTLDVLVRFHDCDDKHTDNRILSSTDPNFQTKEDISKGYTFITDNAALAWAFPPRPLSMWAPIPGIGPKKPMKYGLLAGSVAARKGRIHVDDEDSSNKNWLKKYIGYNFKADLSTDEFFYGITPGKNTDYYVVLTTDAEFRANNPYYPTNYIPN